MINRFRIDCKSYYEFNYKYTPGVPRVPKKAADFTVSPPAKITITMTAAINNQM